MVFLGKGVCISIKIQLTILELGGKTVAEFTSDHQYSILLFCLNSQELCFPASLQLDEAMRLVLASKTHHCQAKEVKILW